METRKILTILVLGLALMVFAAKVSEAAPMGTAFTYQGRLIDKNMPADGLYDFQFKLYDSNDPCTGSPLGSPIDINDLDVLDGHFTVELDFGSGIFDGNAVWLETRVVQSPLGSDPCTLRPLLELTPTPYALYAKSAGFELPIQVSGSFAFPAAVIEATNTSTSNGYAIAGIHSDTGTVGYVGGYYGIYGRHGSSFNWGWLGGSDYGVYGRNINDNYGYLGGTDYAGYFYGDTKITQDLIVEGNLGIGRSNPRTSLDTNGRISTGHPATSSPGTVTFFPPDGAAWFHIDNGPAGGRPTGRLRVSHGNNPGDNEILSILQTGKVGIGTTSPAAMLDALHSSGNYGRLGTNLDGVYGQSSQPSGSGVAGINDGGGNGVYGRSNDGKAVHGVSSAGHAGYFEGDVTLTKPAGLGGGELVLRTATYNEPGRYRIRFANNYLGLFAGDDTQNQQFAFVSKWGNTREYDARLKVHGKASASWGTYIALTHDGNDGLIETDVGDIVLSPAGNVGIGTTSPDEKLTVVDGTIKASTSDPTGRAVSGYATNTGVSINYGGYFESEGQDGIGVYGWGKDTGDVDNYGGRFKASGTYGKGVLGAALGSHGIGVFGWGGQWDFYAANNIYGPFTGGHEVKLSDDFPKAVKPGMIVSVTGEAQVRHGEDGELSISSTLPTVKLADVANDKAVFGAFAAEAPLPRDHWYQSTETDRFGTVNALGEGRVWVCNINGNIEAGDYITASTIPGYGQMQADDLLHSYTLGKAIETVDWYSITETVEHDGRTFKVYLIAVVYTSG